MKGTKVPDIAGTGDVECSCGQFVFTCYDALRRNSNQRKCPFCRQLLEIIEEDPNWKPQANESPDA
jgi:hypothetical protein